MIAFCFLTGILLAPQAFDSKTENISGWTIHLQEGVTRDHAQQWKSARRELENQLYRIGRVVPDGPLAKIKQVPLWVCIADKQTPGAAFHPNPDWLKDHDMNPAMAGGIEIGSLDQFISWTYEQPWMIMHELAHAYHFKFTDGGFENAEIKAAFDAAAASKKYESVLHYDGQSVKHYALNNQMEYFAEMSEAYFGQNDFYPFIRAELKTFDPETFQLMEKVWGPPQKRAN